MNAEVKIADRKPRAMADRTATRLAPKAVEKPWGRRDLPAPLGPVSAGQPPVGEIRFEDKGCRDAELQVKYIFTAERLSVQVHPGDEAARRAGSKSGKDEAWLVLAAEGGAEIGLGLRSRISPEELRAASLDGQIEQMVDWRPARTGDVYYVPAGTIHAIGPGLTLIEVQQNCDLTYRLFDYGRGRELHLAEAVAVATAGPYVPCRPPRDLAPGRVFLAGGGAFILERWEGIGLGRIDPSEPCWIIPLCTGGTINGEKIEPGQVWVVKEGADVSLDGEANALIAYAGSEIRSDLLTAVG